MNNFYKSLSNKIINSPYISRWSVLVIDTLVATFATMSVYLVLGFFTNTIPVFNRYAFIGTSALVTTMATFLLFGTYRGIMRHTTIQEIIRLGFAVMFKSVILFILFISLRKVAGFTFKPINIFFAQVADVLSQEDLPNPELQSLLLNCLFALAKMKEPEWKVKAVFELRAASLAGYQPDLFGCHICGNQSPDKFDISEGMLECTACRGSGGGIRMPVTPGVLEAMRYICLCEPKRLLAFQIGPENLALLANLTEAYLTTQLERGFSTLDFYKSLLI